jgi:protein involved in polysaccharide export with SLBB domain
MRQLTIILFILLASSANSQAANDFLGIQQALGLGTSASGATPAVVPAVPVAAPVGTPMVIAPESSPQSFDYAANLNSDVFGAQLFTGSFMQQGAMQFNPDYMIEIGDQIQVQLWGGFIFNGVLSVDPQGNVFLPQIGPLKVLGVHNQDLQSLIDIAVRRVFRANVYSYASLAAAQPVRIFVSGFVNRPGLYNGTSMDSLLYYLDQAGGIDANRGSFLDVQVKRGEQVRTTINLYDFLFKGHLPLVQLMDGDVIFIPARQSAVKVTGLVENAKSFEFKSSSLTVNELSRLARPQATATHVRVTRNKGMVKNMDYYPIAESGEIRIDSGDEVEFTADKKPGNITVRVEGQHQSPQEYVLPYGSHFGELIHRLKFTDRSDTQNIQLFRESVRERQKEMLQTSLKSLEASVLTARSGSTDEALLRKEEADMILQWVERAKTIQPNGQVLIAQTTQRDELLLENGDIIKVPTLDGLVVVSGEVVFPNAIAYSEKLELEDYINSAGGYTQNANSARIVIAHQDGSFEEGSSSALRAGDEVLVLPEVQIKSRQMWKEISQAIYQIAISARLVTGKGRKSLN